MQSQPVGQEGIGRLGMKGVGVYGVGQVVQALRRDAAGAELLQGLPGGGKDGAWLPIQPGFQALQSRMPDALGAQKVVGDHLGGQRALVIEGQGDAQQARQGPADEDALMEIGVDEVGTEAQRRRQRRGRQNGVQEDLAPRGADRNGAQTRQWRAFDVQSGRVLSHRVGDQANAMPHGLKAAQLPRDADVATVVVVEGGGSNG